MHTKRLFLQDLTDQHLTLMLRAVEWCYDVKIEEWLERCENGKLAIYELEGKGLIGLQRFNGRIFIEFVVGSGLKPLGPDIIAWIKEMCGECEIDLLVGNSRPGLMRYYERVLGFRPVATWMRYSHGK